MWLALVFLPGNALSTDRRVHDIPESWQNLDLYNVRNNRSLE
jgi:hypothetical protein